MREGSIGSLWGGCQRPDPRFWFGYPEGVGTSRDIILLEGVEVPAALGVSKAERGMRRLVQIDLEIECAPSKAGRTDRLVHTTDYGEIYRTVEEVASSRDHRLVEALAERIADALLGRFPIEGCTVTVRKPNPLAGSLRFAGVRIHRSKS